MDHDDVPLLDGVHHLKLPVRDLDRSLSWYGSRLGYAKSMEFHEGGRLMGIGMEHPRGGPGLALRLDPERAAAASGFDYFAIGVPTKADLEALAARLTGLGERHAGVHRASVGWILPHLSDPDGHELRFYSAERHTEQGSAANPLVVEDPRETAEAAEREEQVRRADQR